MSAPRTAWDSLIDVVTAYVSDRPVLGGRDSDRAVILAQIERTRAAVSALPAAHAPPDESSPWPIADVLAKLADAADVLLRKHDYDGHGYEEIATCRDRAREIVRGARGAAPEQKQWRWCRCQGIDPIAHVHYAESPNRCARCTSCTGFVGWPRAGYDTLPVGGAAGSPDGAACTCGSAFAGQHEGDCAFGSPSSELGEAPLPITTQQVSQANALIERYAPAAESTTDVQVALGLLGTWITSHRQYPRP